MVAMPAGAAPPILAENRNRPPGDQARNMRYRLEERFGDFKSVDNLTLPARWIIRFTYGVVYKGDIHQYDITETKISSNVTLDPKTFDLR
jgi:hypothetical protein